MLLVARQTVLGVLHFAVPSNFFFSNVFSKCPNSYQMYRIHRWFIYQTHFVDSGLNKKKKQLGAPVCLNKMAIFSVDSICVEWLLAVAIQWSLRWTLQWAHFITSSKCKLLSIVTKGILYSLIAANSFLSKAMYTCIPEAGSRAVESVGPVTEKCLVRIPEPTRWKICRCALEQDTPVNRSG